jgi:hypothetical protein
MTDEQKNHYELDVEEEYSYYAQEPRDLAESFIDKLYLKFADEKFREILMQISTSLRTMTNIQGFSDTHASAALKLLGQITAKYGDEEFIDIVAMASYCIDKMQQVCERKSRIGH